MPATRKTSNKAAAPAAEDPQVRDARFAVRYLEQAIDEIYVRMMAAEGDDFARLANALARLSAVLLNGHRIISILTGGLTPMDEALRELKSLDFSED